MSTAFDLTRNIHGILQPAEGTRKNMPSRLRAHITGLFRKRPGRSSMLNISVQELGDVSILHCQGRILFGNSNLSSTARSRKNLRTLVLDLAQVDGIDAGGLGVLLDLLAWAHAAEVGLKLLNVMPPVQRLLESTRLTGVFEVCSVREMFHLMCRAQGMDAPCDWRADR